MSWQRTSYELRCMLKMHIMMVVFYTSEWILGK